MKRFVGKIFIFILCISTILYVYCLISLKAGTAYNGINTAGQIKLSFRQAVQNDYDCYFLGNSRIYRDINPDKFTEVDAYNFAHDNDGYNQMYYKLLYLLEENADFQYLVIGTDYFQFSFLGDSRNYVYNRMLGIEYMRDYNDSLVREVFNNAVQYWKIRRETVRFCIPYLRGEYESVDNAYLKENGQYIVPGTATPEDTVTRSINIMEIQREYFEKIIECCVNHNIELYVVMPPARDEELSSYTAEQRADFDAMIEDALAEHYAGHYINCSDLAEFKHYSNYADITHLNEDAADAFSEYLNSVFVGNDWVR